MGSTGNTVGLEEESRARPQTTASAQPSGADASTGVADRTPELSTSEIYEILYNPRRRAIVDYLLSADGTATRSDLAEYLAAEETDQPVAEVSSYDRKRLYIGLYQTHLPKLAELGVIAYDEDRGTMELRDTVRQLEPYLDGIDPWPPARYDLVVAGSLGACLLLGALGIGMFGTVSTTALALVGLFGLALLVVFRTVRLRGRRSPFGVVRRR